MGSHASTEGDGDSAFAATVATPPPELAASDSLPSEPDESAVDAQDAPTLSHVGRYALKRPLGSGGIGTVYEAWDPLLSRTVAVKTLQFDLDTPSRLSLDRLYLNEARAVAGLTHPHIVTVYDAGLSDKGVYIAMARLHGRDLRQALAEGWRPGPVAAAQVARRVADALAYAHARGVVHCDIKPANIFLSGKGKPTVLDFGIARAAHGAAAPVLEGLIAGSPHYLAPEQLRREAIDGRVDVYALGVVLYEMLTGRKAFDGDSLEQITTAVLHNRPAPVHDVSPAVSRSLSDIVARAMAREPAERFDSAQALAQALRRWHERHAHDDLAKAEESPAPKRPRRAAVTAAAAAVAALALALGLGLLRDPTPEPAAIATAVPSTTVAVQAADPLPSSPPAPEALAGDAGTGAVAESAASAPTEAAATDSPRDSRPPKPASTPRRKPAKVQVATPTPAAPPAPAAAPARGVVQMAISPWGQVEVDGRPAGVTPPLAQLDLSEGSHTITVRNGDNPPHSITVQVSADKPVVVRHRFGS